MEIKKKKGDRLNFIKKHNLHQGLTKKRVFWTITFFVVGVLLILFGAKIYLYFKYITGNDLALRISSDKENFFIKNGEISEVKIKIYAVTNPFCNVNCSISFIDLSENKIIEKKNFIFSLPGPIEEKYNLSSERFSKGQKLYRYEIKCNNLINSLCESDGKVKRRSLLLTLNHDYNEQQAVILNETKFELASLYERLEMNIDYLTAVQKHLNSTIESSELFDSSRSLNKEYFSLMSSLNESFKSYEKGDFENLIIGNDNLNKRYDIYQSSFKSINSSFSELKDRYNECVEDIENLRANITEIKYFNLDNQTAVKLNNFIIRFNNFVELFNEKNNLSLKEDSLTDLEKDFSILKTEIINLNSTTYGLKANVSLNNIVIKKIAFVFENSSFYLKDPEDICCLYGVCDKCCTDCSEKNYPIILIHGHNFNEAVSADSRLNDFSSIQEKLDNYSYIDAGSILISNYDSEYMSLLGKTNSPVVFKASYYFDILNNGGESTIIQTKTDNIDTYAIRLKEIIDIAKFKTGKKKVILVGHSMGGLVIRRYLQIFGEESISKAIFIAVPNKGINGQVLNFCSLLGTKLECKDMDSSSLFMSKLNSQKFNMPTYNIIGLGCDTYGESGDGIIKNSSAFLDNVDNSYVNGTCDSFKFKYFHTQMLDINKYPEVFEVVKESLENN